MPEFDFESSVAVQENDKGQVVTRHPFDFESSHPVNETYIEALKPPPKENLIDALGKVFHPIEVGAAATRNILTAQAPEEQIARSQNIYAISKATGLSMEETTKNYENLRKMSDITGIQKQMDEKDLMQLAVGAGLIADPIGTGAGLIAYTIVDKAIPIEKFLPSDTSDSARSAVELVDFIAKGAIAGGAFKAAPKLFEKFTLNKLQAKGLPISIALNADQLAKIPKEDYEALGIKDKYLAAADQGIKITIPTEKLLHASKDIKTWGIGDDKPFDPTTDEFKAQDQKIVMVKLKEAGEAAKNAVSRLKQGLINTFNPYLPVERNLGSKAYSDVIRAIHTPDAEIVGFDNAKSTTLDKNFVEIEKFFNGFNERDLRDFNITRGDPESPAAAMLQDAAKKRLTEKLKDPRLVEAITEASDYVYKYAKENGIDLNYFEDYFYGAYKNDKGQVDNFLDYWQSTERYTKQKTLPTIADAEAFGLTLKDPNPITNIKKEMRAVANRAALLQLRKRIVEDGHNYATFMPGKVPEDIPGALSREATPEQLKVWRKIEDNAFKGMLFAPEYAKLVNSLLSTNKVSGSWWLKGLRQFSFIARQIKFLGSMFHMTNMAKAAISDEALGAVSKEGYKNIIKAFKSIDQSTPEYKDFVNLGGGQRYSLDIQAQEQLNVAIDKIRKGDFLKGIVKLPAAAAQSKWIPASPGMVTWMFDEFIPSLKYNKFTQEVMKGEERLGRPLTDGEKINIIKTIQNFYGEMNERLFGRSATATSALRLIFSAPGYGEGNFRTIIASGAEIGRMVKSRKITAEGAKNLRFIANTLVTTLMMSTIGTMILTGKAPKPPKNANDLRDLFKIHTNMKDGNGDDVYYDLMTYDKDYWSVYGNILTGKAMSIPGELLRRVSGMTGSQTRILTDMMTIVEGGMVYDFKGQPIYYKTDDFPVKLGKFMTYEGVVAQPIALGTLQQSKQKGGDWLTSLTASIAGVKPTSSEQVKELKGARADLFSLQDTKRGKQIEIDKLYNENPEQANKEIDKFNAKQIKKLAEVAKKEGIKLEGAPPKNILKNYIITDVRGERVKMGSEIESMFKEQARIPRQRILSSEQQAKLDQLLRDQFNR